jgi:molecular chaperone GrpE
MTSRDKLQTPLVEHEEHEELVRRYALRAHEAEAELELAKARIRRDADRAVEQKRREILGNLLEVVDDLDRALDAVRHEREIASQLLKGVDLVRDKFLAKLSDQGVARAPAIGKDFDPTRHEAVTTVPVEDDELDGVVVGVVRAGYRIEDEVLRPARVAVGKLAASGPKDDPPIPSREPKRGPPPSHHRARRRSPSWPRNIKVRIA